MMYVACVVVSMLFFVAITFLQVTTSWLTIINDINVIKPILVRSFYVSFYVELPFMIFVCTMGGIIRILWQRKI
jgi:hypothetical protein